MANINGQTIPGGVNWSGIGNAVMNTLESPYNARQAQAGGYNYNDPNDTGGGTVTPVDNGSNGYPPGMSFAGDNAAVNGPGYYSQTPSADGSTNPNKDQSQLLPQGGQAFAYNDPSYSPPWPSIGDMLGQGANSVMGAVSNGLNQGLKGLPPASVLRSVAPRAVVNGATPRKTGLAAMPAPKYVTPPVARPMTKVQQLQAQGLSPSQAYNHLAAQILQSQQGVQGQTMAAIRGNSGQGAVRPSNSSTPMSAI